MRNNHYLKVYARLKPGATVDSAQQDMSGIAAQLAREYPNTNTSVGAAVVALREQLLGDTRLGIWVLAFGVGCVLMIACANVAGLLLARAVGREKEIAVRSALGAGRWRLIRQNMAESLALALCGGAAGLIIAAWSIPFLERLVPRSLASWSQPQLDWRLLLFTFLIATISAVAFGGLPAVTLSGVDLGGSLQSGGRSGIGGRARVRAALVVGEVALAIILCVGAGLMVKTMWKLAHVELGFRPEGVLTVRTSLPMSPESAYRDAPARVAFYERVLEKVRAIPGVTAAGYTTYLPLTNRGGTRGFLIENGPPLAPGQINDANNRVVSEDYLQTMGVRLLRGRYLTRFDRPDGALVAVVNEAMARQYWPNQNAIGRRFRFNPKTQWITIVGIVENVRQMGLDVEGRAEMYFPCTQASFGYVSPRDLAVRVTDDPMRYAAAVREAVWSVDRNQPVSDVQPMTQLVSADLQTRRVEVQLLGVFAGLALLLAALGLYGLLSYMVSQRIREIGVRMALGAQPRQILHRVLGDGLRLVLAGLLLGAAGGLAVTRVMQRLLYQVEPTDTSAFAIAALVLLFTGLLACYLPARQAASTSPMVALRYE
jgi:predicted permease